MISVDEALSLLTANRPVSTIESLTLNEALGRTLAAPIIAKVTQPPAAVSAMDGYAVRLTDVSAPQTQLKVIGEAPAGTPFTGQVGRGEAVRIFTGGQVPSGADHIVIQEDATRSADEITCHEGYETSAHIRIAGLDFKTGDKLVETGTRLGSSELAIAAAANLSDIQAYRKLRIGLIASGDELRPPGSKLAPGQIVNSNPTALSAMLTQWGADPIDLGIATDDENHIVDIIQNADDIDIFVPIGGASVGDHDHMRPAFKRAGFEPVFEKIAVKPGKPTWFSRRDNTLVLGLPGNPASALVCAHLFLKPLLIPADPSQKTQAILLSDLKPNGPREHFMRASATLNASGRLEVRSAINQDSSLMSPFLSCNALIRRAPIADARAPGDLVDIQLLEIVNL